MELHDFDLNLSKDDDADRSKIDADRSEDAVRSGAADLSACAAHDNVKIMDDNVEIVDRSIIDADRSGDAVRSGEADVGFDLSACAAPDNVNMIKSCAVPENVNTINVTIIRKGQKIKD